MVPKISVLIGIFNCASTLQEALDSLYSQTFQDFEIILCDDGSSDNTYSLALENQKKHPNIVLIKNDHNMGLNFTLNRCLAIARGKYIARMDGDDISLPNRFEIELSFIENHPNYSIVSTPMIFFDEHGDYRQGIGKGEVKKSHFIKRTPFCHAPCLVRKEAYDAVGGYSESKWLLRVEDYHLWMKMYEKGYIGYNLKDPLYKMRDDRNAYSRRKFKYRINEAYVKYLCIRNLDLPCYNLIYVLRPLIIGLLPKPIYNIIHKR